MGDSKPWRERSAPGSDGQIDTDLPPLVSIITARPVDLTKPDEQYRNCPRQYVWAARFDGCDQPKPDDADEICEMSMQHHSLLPFLQISPVGHQFPEPLYTVGYSMTEYLRWKLEFFHLDAAFVWDILGLPRDALQYFNANAKAVLKRLHPVFVEAHNGLHFGRWVNDICSRPTCASAFFIQAHGDQNFIPCRRCLNSYCRSSPVWPFSGYVSFDPILKGRYGNYAWGDYPCSREEPIPSSSSPSDPGLLTDLRHVFDLNAPATPVSLMDRWVWDAIPEARDRAISDQMNRVKTKREGDGGNQKS